MNERENIEGNEGSDDVRVTISMPEDLKKAAEEIAKSEDRSLSSWIRGLVRNSVKQEVAP